MYTGRYDPPPGNNLAAYRRTQDGHGGRAAERRAEMEQIAHCIALTARDFAGSSKEVHDTVAAICEKYPLYK